MSSECNSEREREKQRQREHSVLSLILSMNISTTYSKILTVLAVFTWGPSLICAAVDISNTCQKSEEVNPPNKKLPIS